MEGARSLRNVLLFVRKEYAACICRNRRNLVVASQRLTLSVFSQWLGTHRLADKICFLFCWTTATKWLLIHHRHGLHLNPNQLMAWSWQDWAYFQENCHKPDSEKSNPKPRCISFRSISKITWEQIHKRQLHFSNESFVLHFLLVSKFIGQEFQTCEIKHLGDVGLRDVLSEPWESSNVIGKQVKPI